MFLNKVFSLFFLPFYSFTHLLLKAFAAKLTLIGRTDKFLALKLWYLGIIPYICTKYISKTT